VYAHGGMIGLDGEKMSKSRGNLVLVSRLLESGVDPMVLRLALIGRHYREDWYWSDAELSVAGRRLHRWRDAVRLPAGLEGAPVVARLRAALADDLDTPTALAAVDAWAAASLSIDGDDAEAPALVASALDALLGITLH
jgi:L-cysteine:1D-myo-inositol 2-amino-2-deoxy-alpha-D-glucopyranoside ligase